MVYKHIKAVGSVVIIVIFIIIIAAASVSRNSAPLIARVQATGGWSGAFQGEDFNSRTVDGYGNKDVSIGCSSGIYSLTVQKSGEDGTLTVKVMKGDDVLGKQSTSASYGVVTVSGNC